MRRAKTVPLVPVEDGCEKCCNGILTALAAEMAWWQRITYGTTAWRISMGRRQVVESVNAALKGVFTDLGRGFMRVMGVTKMTVMLGFTIAAYNLDRIRESREFRNSEGSFGPNSWVGSGSCPRFGSWVREPIGVISRLCAVPGSFLV
jgi:hypothetical protein